MNDETKIPRVMTAQYVLIGPPQDPAALANAFATLELAQLGAAPPANDCDPTTTKIPTTNVKIWAQPDGGRIVEVITASGRAELRVTPTSTLIV